VKRRKKHVPHVNHERWLVSYADFITLLFAFFVVMYSTAQVDKRKVGKLAQAIQVAFAQLGPFPTSPTANPETLAPVAPPDTNQPPPPASNLAENVDLAALHKELEQALAAEIARGEVALRNQAGDLIISLREVGFFDSGSAEIKATSQPAFSRMASLLGQHNYQIRIEGHTDNVPIHNSKYASNWELSTARSTEMIQLLITKYGFVPQRLSAAGYAEFHPIASNGTEPGRAQNRRVDVVVLRTPPTATAPAASPSSQRQP